MTVVSYKNVKRPIIPPGDLPMLALFARGEQGGWYEPSDLNNYGTLGSELVPDPEFSSAEQWDCEDGSSVEGGVLAFDISGERVGAMNAEGVRTIPGVSYEVVVDFKSRVSGSYYVIGFNIVYIQSGSFQRVTRILQGNGNIIGIRVYSGGTGEITRLSVRPLISLNKATMFQDVEGVEPVTSVEQPVGLIHDKSGNGNHASQLTVPARPYLSARVNLLNNSNDLTQNYWTKAVAVEPNQPDPFGGSGAHLLTVETQGAYRRIFRNNVTAVGVKSVHTIYAKAGTARFINQHSGSGAGVAFDLVDGVATVAPAIASTTQVSMTPIGDGWWRCEIRYLEGYHSVYWMVTTNGGTVGEVGDSVYVYGLQVEHGEVATKYQRVTSATDYDWRDWPLRLEFDSVDDVLDYSFVPKAPAYHLAQVADGKIKTTEMPVFRQPTQPQITGVRRNLLEYSDLWGDERTSRRFLIDCELENVDVPNPAGGVGATLVTLLTSTARTAELIPGTPGDRTTSFWFKAMPGETGTVRFGNRAGASFSNRLEAEVVDYEWRRLHHTIELPESPVTTDGNVYAVDRRSSSPDHLDRFLVWGGQIEDGSVPTSYQAVRTATDFDGSGLPVGSIWIKTDAIDQDIGTYRYNGATWDDVGSGSGVIMSVRDNFSSLVTLDRPITAAEVESIRTYASQGDNS